jgi:predicted AlkP superfamily pyrophosphatase or phosphodiesterase
MRNRIWLLKIIIYVVISNIKCDNQSNTKEEKKPKLLLIGIDGYLEQCADQADHEFLKWMAENGSYTFTARTAIETLSSCGWSNILCGMDTEDTGITQNEWVPEFFYQRKMRISPITDKSKPIPCIFEELKKNDPSLINFASFTWYWLQNISNTTIPGVTDKEYFQDCVEIQEAKSCDSKLFTQTLKMLEEDFNFFFMYIGTLDWWGHYFGWCVPEYIERLSTLDKWLIILIEELERRGILKDMYIMFVTDHGGTYGKIWHGEKRDDNIHVPWMIYGPNIKKGYKISNTFVKNIDTSPTIMKIFGYGNNEYWRGKSVDEIFN